MDSMRLKLRVDVLRLYRCSSEVDNSFVGFTKSLSFSDDFDGGRIAGAETFVSGCSKTSILTSAEDPKLQVDTKMTSKTLEFCSLSLRHIFATRAIFMSRKLVSVIVHISHLPFASRVKTLKVPLLWSQLPTLAQHLVLVARDLWDSGVGPPQWLEDGIMVESLQVGRKPESLRCLR